jgi:hypothetical protein
MNDVGRTRGSARIQGGPPAIIGVGNDRLKIGGDVTSQVHRVAKHGRQEVWYGCGKVRFVLSGMSEISAILG